MSGLRLGAALVGAVLLSCVGGLAACNRTAQDVDRVDAGERMDGSLGPVPDGSRPPLQDSGAEFPGPEFPDPDSDLPYLRFVPIGLDHEPAQMTALKFIPGKHEFLVLTRDGFVHHYALGEVSATHVGSFVAPDVHAELDCGLISLTFDPDFDSNRFLYLGQCFSRTESGIMRLRFDAADYESMSASAVEIVRYGDPASTRPWHNVGQMGFEADGTLWALFGDKSIRSHGQDRSTALGSLVRIRPSRDPSTGGYTPAADNPHAANPSWHPDVYAYGLRSPWTGTRDSQGRWLIADVGSSRIEEINLVTAPGQNFGWATQEGRCGSACEGDMVDPIVQWGRSDDHAYVRQDPYALHRSGRVAWMGPVYEPPAPELDRYAGKLTGRALFGELCVGFVRALEVDVMGEVQMNHPVGHLAGATGWDVGPDGYLYAASFGRCTTSASATYPQGRIYRAVPSTMPVGFVAPEGDFPSRLSDFGLFPSAPNLDIVPAHVQNYTPRWELWSNGLGKRRHVVTPEGTDIRRDGDVYRYPDGTLFFKTFSAARRPIETRVMQWADGIWYYAAYRWNAAGTDAVRLDMEDPVPVSVTLDGMTFDHQIPSYRQCRSCHEVGARQVLGYTPLQLGDGAELDTPDALTRQVMGYVFANCTHCHDGSGGAEASFSMLPEDFIANTLEHPTEGSASGLGVRVVPGAPHESVLYEAITGGNEGQGIAAMPPLGVQRLDDHWEVLVREWILSLRASDEADAGL